MVHIVNISFALAMLLSFQTAFSHTVPRRSVLSWLGGGEQTRIEEHFVPGYKPVLEVHQYNGVQVTPVNGDPPVYFPTKSPVHLEQLFTGPDPQIANLFYNAVPLLPEVERMQEVDLTPFGPYVQLLPEPYIERLRITFETEGEQRVGSSGKAKLLKFLQVLKDKKLKPLKKLYNKKVDALESALNYLPSLHKPHLAPHHPPPAPGKETVIVPATETVVVPAAPPVFAVPPPNFIPVEFLPPPPPYFLPPPPQFLKFEHPPQVAPGAFFEFPTLHEFGKTDTPCTLKDKCGEPAIAFNTPTFHSVSVNHVPVAPPPFGLTPILDEHIGFTTPLHPVEDGSYLPPLPFDLQFSESENVEKFTSPPAQANSTTQWVDERKHVMQVPKPVSSTTTPQSLQSTESSSQTSTTSP